VVKVYRCWVGTWELTMSVLGLFQVLCHLIRGLGVGFVLCYCEMCDCL